MTILTVDFESYYDKQYSLSKLTTEEYLRDPQFEVIGVSVKVGDGEPEWFSGTHEDTAAFLSRYPWDSSLAIAHNAMFDMAILNWHFNIIPKRIADTLSMARALHGTEVGGSLAALADYYALGKKGTEVIQALGKKRDSFTPSELDAYSKYCINDVELTYKLFQKMYVGFPLQEMKLIDMTVRMFTEPRLVLANLYLEAHLNTIQQAKDELLSRAIIDKEQLMSNPKLAKLLTDLGVDPPMKTSLTTGRQTYAFSKTDEAFTALLEHPDILVQSVVAARLGVKSTLEETRTQRFIDISQRGPLPVPLRYYAAHTGRWGGDDKVNLQNIPRTSPLRRAIRAPDGYILVDSDSSQIEARILAWLARQLDLVDAFERGEDVYRIMASKIYGVTEAAVTKDQRFVGKWTILGSGYGLGAKKYQAQLKNYKVDMHLEECERIIAVYRQTYQHITQLWKQAGRAILAMMRDQYLEFGPGGCIKVEGSKGIRLPNGMYLRYKNLRTTSDNEIVYDTRRGKTFVPTRLYGGKLVENLCQALARIVIGEQMLVVNKKYPVVLTVHDSVACLAPVAEKDAAYEYVDICMKLRPEWAQDLPLNCETKTGFTYGG